jgi:hypothetical protein
MAITASAAIEIAHELAAGFGGPYPMKSGAVSATLEESSRFSESLGVSEWHWHVTLEYVVPDGVVLCPDQLSVLVTAESGKPVLATLV